MKRRLLSLSTPRPQSPAPAEPAEGRRRGRTWSLWRLLPMLLLVCAALVVSAGAAEITPTEPQQGDGTENNPYQISSAAELYWFAGLVNGNENTAACAVLTNDITINEGVLDAGGTTLSSTPQYKWTPIGSSYDNRYTGTFDGQGHTINGLYANISSNNDTYVGLFGCIGNGKVKNVTIDDSYLSGNCNNTKAVYAGGVCGKNVNGTIENCHFIGVVYGNAIENSNAYVGGVCGKNDVALDGNASITDCSSSGTVSGSGNSGLSIAYVGGVCGENDANSGTATITYCYSTGAVSSSGSGEFFSNAYVGGVCGRNYAHSGTASISNCYSSGNVTATSTGTYGNAYAGGVCGRNYAHSGTASISNCYWLKSNSSSATNGIGNGNGEATEKTADQFASGEVAWLLNQGQENGPWRQNLGDSGGAFPVLDQSHDLVIRVNANSTSYYNIAQIPSPGGGQAYFDANDQHIDLATHTFAANETIYLKTAVKVTVEYGNGTPDDVTYFVRDASNNHFKLPSAPTRTGYTFGGWSNGSTTHQPEATVTITADTTFTAQWTANQYTVKFDANGGDGSISNQAFTYDVPQALTANTFTRTGYTFAGWNTAADGSGTAYSDGQEVSNLTAVSGGTVTLYAQWTANTYTVTVETSGNGTATASPASATMGTEITLTATPRSGCHFVRWDVVSGDITIQDNQFTMPAGDVTVKAVFARNAAAKTPSQQAIDKIERAKDGDVVTIDLPKGKTKLDKEVFETLAGRDVTLVLTLEGEVSWTIYGRDVPETGSFADTDMGVTMNTSTIPVDIINAITGEVSTMQLTLAHDGDFGFTLTLTAPLGAKYADLWANLYYYDGNAETLTFQTAAQIDRDGTASLKFTHASQYVIVIDDRDHTPKDFPFADVTTGDWFYEAVDYVFQRDLMNGTGGARFTPNGTASRAMVATILWRMAGEPQVNYAMSFADVPAGTWYTEAVRWAASEGIVTGYSDTKFGPDDPVTREQFAAMLYRYAQTLGEGFTGSWSFPLDFPDAAEVSDYAYEALCWMTKEKVLEGMEDGNLHPQSTATRAQLATMLMRFCQAIDG